MELLAGVVVALAALALVLEPLVVGRRVSVTGTSGPFDDGDLDFSDVEESESPKIQALLAIREIEFDRETGKLSEEDYASLKTRYQQAALAAIEQEESGGAGAGARNEAASVCPVCGPRPETSAKFCSDCGRLLNLAGTAGQCNSCGASVPNGAKFCGECGSAL